jgi:hypothetical protein
MQATVCLRHGDARLRYRQTTLSALEQVDGTRNHGRAERRAPSCGVPSEWIRRYDRFTGSRNPYELPTFWFVGGLGELQQTTPAQNSLKNLRETPAAFSSFWLLLFPVHEQSHGQFCTAEALDRFETQE